MSAPNVGRTPPVSGGHAFPLWILAATMIGMPLFFSRWTEDAFDFPKGVLLVTLGMVLAGWWTAAALAAARQEGLAAWFAAIPARRTAGARRDPIGAALVLFAVSSFVSSILSPNPALGLFGAQGSYAGALLAAATVVVYFAARGVPADRATFSRFATAIAIAAALASLYGIVQFSGRDPLNWVMVPYLRGLRRIAGTMGQPNLLGCFLIMALPLVAWRVRYGGTVARAACAAVVLLSLSALALTFSRAAWVAFAVALAVAVPLFAWTRPLRAGEDTDRRRRGALWITGGMVVLFAVASLLLARSPAGTRVMERVRDIANPAQAGTQSRFFTWQVGLDLGGQSPLIGKGVNQFGLEFPAYRTPAFYRLEFGAIPPTAHNNAINIFAEQGAFGSLAALLVLALTLLAAARALSIRDPALHLGVVASIAALAGFAVWDLVNYTVAAVGAIAAVLAGWLSGVAAVASSKAPAVTSRRPLPLWAVATAALVWSAAFVPLVLNPTLAQTAKRAGLAEPAVSTRRVSEFTRAVGHAPWEGRHQHHLADACLSMAFAQGDSATRLDWIRRARVAIDAAIAAEPRSALFHSRRGWILGLLAVRREPGVRIEDVRGAYDEALRRDPANLAILERSGETWLLLRQHAPARAMAYQALGMYPDAARPTNYLGVIAMRERRWKDAADTLRIASRLDWKEEIQLKSIALTNLSAACMETGLVAEAVSSAEEAQRLDPTSAAAKHNLELARQRLAGAPPRPAATP